MLYSKIRGKYMKDLIQFGFYIIEGLDKREWLDIECEHIYTISNCISTHHPEVDEFLWGNSKDHELYREKLKLSKESFDEMHSEISRLLGNGFYCDGLFKDLETANRFFTKYFTNIEAILVGVSTTQEHFTTILENGYPIVLEYGNGINPNVIHNEVNGVWIGNEIVGYDISSFHSYLCNSLHKEIRKFATPDFNKYGLLKNDFNEVCEFAKIIEDKGEPVEWVPVVLHKINEGLHKINEGGLHGK